MKFKKTIKRGNHSIELTGELVREANLSDKKKAGIDANIPCIIVKYTIADYTYWGIWQNEHCKAA